MLSFVALPHTPLSFAQQRLWFEERLEPDTARYNIPLVVELEGTLDVGAFQRALEEIINRHAALRTAFPCSDGQPRQEIQPPHDFDLPIRELGHLPDAERTARSERRIEVVTRTPFDLETGPPIRAELLRLGPTRHLLVAAVHHIVFDAWSSGIFFQELGAGYEAFRAGAASPLPPLEAQYAEFAAWQREQLSGDALAQHLAYWSEHLRPPLPVLSLPLDRPRPAHQRRAGRRERLFLPASLFDDLRELSRRHGATTFMTLLAAFAVLLHRYSGQDDVIVGTGVANRTRPRFEGLIGFFLNTLPLRIDLSGDPTVSALLKRIRRVALAAYEHQDLPFERLVEALAPERNAAYSPICQAVLAFDNTPGPERTRIELADLVLTQRPVATNTAKFDLTLVIMREVGGWRAELEYSADLFEQSTAVRQLSQLRTLLHGFVASGDVPISHLALMEEDEGRRIVFDGNETAAPYPRDLTIAEAFGRQAAQTPDAEAVVWDRGRWSYRELDARSDAIARTLGSFGVSPGDRVGVCLERSADVVSVLLGVLKAGAAYVPLDPADPELRLRELVDRAGLGFVVSHRTDDARLRATGATPIAVDAEAPAPPAINVPREPPATTAESVAYVLFTSGSTGTPKAVAVPHRAVVRLAFGLPCVPLGPGATVLHFAPLAFDASTFEIWGPLLNGGRLAIAPPGLLTVSEIEVVLDTFAANVLWLTSSLFNAVVDERPRALGRLSHLLIGGEALSVDHVERALAALAETTIINGYGPTECTTFSCCHPIPRDRRGGWRSIPIGRALPNTRTYVLDPRREPVPVGVPGELWIGGDGVAIGYLNTPDLTAERFVRDPFVAAADARMYRTGDRVRRLDDGTLEFLGRLDDQIKVRGFRIEPREIEAALAAHPAVRAAAIVRREETPGDARLIAYVVASNGHVSASELRSHLALRLPQSMLPSAYVTLERLPLLPSGKLDRQRLPPPDAGTGRPMAAAHPETPTERAIAAIWCEVLGIPFVGADENFFHRGGHSLMATQVIARLRDRLQIGLEVRAIFDAPTVRDLARLIDGRRMTSSAVPGIAAADRRTRLPLSFAQQRLWFLHQWDPASGAYNVPACYRLVGALDLDALTQALAALVRRHESLRTVFPAIDGEPFQQIVEADALPVPVTDLTGLDPPAAEREAARQASEESSRPFDLAAGPIVRTSVWRLGATEHVLLLTMHHIVVDGWSMSVLRRELSALYVAAMQGVAPPLPPLAIQYADFAVWQRQWLQGDVLERQLNYWRERLRPPLPAMPLPADRARPDEVGADGGRVEFTLPAPLIEALTTQGAAEGATLFMVLLAGFQALLHCRSGARDILVGTPVANRPHRALEGLIGFFANTLVLRATISEGMTFRELLIQTRDRTVDAYSHQDLPFEQLIEHLQPTRSPGQTPLVQVMFVLQNTGGAGLSLPGVTAEELRWRNDYAKFDLTVMLRERTSGVAGAIAYRKDLFEPRTLERLVADFERVLHRAAERFDARLETLSAGSGANAAAPAGQPPADSRETVAVTPAIAAVRGPENAIEATLKAMWESLLGRAVGVHENFFEIGGHSLLAVRLFVQIEKQWAVELPLATLFRTPTIAELAALIGRRASVAQMWSSLVPIQPHGGRPPLFCVHGLGGNVLGYYSLASRLGPDQPVYGFQASGLDGVTPFHTSVTEMAAHYVREMRAVQPSGPYCLGGHSFGGNVAFEMAQQLVAAGDRVSLLALFDTQPPGDRAASAAMLGRRVVGVLDRLFLGGDPTGYLARAGRTARRRIAERVWEYRYSRLANGQRRLPAALRQAPRAARYALNRYEPRPYPGRVTLFSAALRQPPARTRHRTMWQSLALGGLVVHEMPGDHLSLLEEPNVAALAERLTECLEETRRTNS